MQFINNSRCTLSNEMCKMVQKCTFIAWEGHQFCRSVCLIDERRCWSVFKQTDRVSACLRIGLWWTVQMCAVSVWHLHHHQGWGGGRVTECIGPRGLALDRLAIGNTGTFHLRSGPIAETRESSPILGTVFKLQRMGNRIKQIPQKLEAVLPDASASRASKQSGISHPQAGFN